MSIAGGRGYARVHRATCGMITSRPPFTGPYIKICSRCWQLWLMPRARPQRYIRSAGRLLARRAERDRPGADGHRGQKRLTARLRRLSQTLLQSSQIASSSVIFRACIGLRLQRGDLGERRDGGEHAHEFGMIRRELPIRPLISAASHLSTVHPYCLAVSTSFGPTYYGGEQWGHLRVLRPYCCTRRRISLSNGDLGGSGTDLLDSDDSCGVSCSTPLPTPERRWSERPLPHIPARFAGWDERRVHMPARWGLREMPSALPCERLGRPRRGSLRRAAGRRQRWRKVLLGHHLPTTVVR